MNLDPALCRQAVLARDARFDGRFFTCVKTTGIYCRPICPARPPKPENCLYLPSAAAAQEAGFRPCLRCRPETAPDFGAWRGTSNTVSRALALIDAGALDAAGVDRLADRLGVGDRQLRRLFLRHLGATPVAVAQTRRVLLAKQLIHETDLSMAEVALASGFGSLRRFNEVFQALFNRPPTALRGAGREGAMQQGADLCLTLGYRAPFDWKAMLDFLALRAIPGVEAVDSEAYVRSIEIGGLTGSVRVRDEPERARLRATIRFPETRALPVIISRLRRMFDLAADPQVIGAALARDAHLSRLVAKRPGLRVPGAWDSFELGVRAIAGQQVTVGAATQLAGRIARDFGAPLPGEALHPAVTTVFPTPEWLARAVITGMPPARAAAISALAGASLSDPGLFERGADLDGSVAKLRALPGIGDWTAQYMAMRAMREPDAFPAADVGLLRALDLGEGRPSVGALVQRAQDWRPWRAYGALHLWMSLSETAPSNSREANHAIVA